MAYIRVVTQATAEPISLEDAKANLRVDHTDDDARIQRHITEAREWVERRVQKAIANVTYAQAFDAFASPLVLSIIPISSIISVSYEDVNDTTQSAAFIFKPPNLVYSSPSGSSWPVAFNRPDSVRVKYIAGEAGIEVIPAPLIAAMHLKIQHLYDGDETDAAIHSLLTNYYTMVA